MKQYDLMFGYLGNGITVCNRNKEINGDYKTIAHINSDRNVTFYEKLPNDIKQEIINFANNATPTISVTQSTPIFNE